LEFRRFIACILLGFCASLSALDPVIATTFFNVWDEPDGRRFTYESPAKVFFTGGDERVRVEYEINFGNQKQIVSSHTLTRADIRKAQAFVQGQRLGLKMPNGGVISAKAERAVILNLNQELQVGLEIIHEDAMPVDNYERKQNVVRSVQPLSALTDLDSIDPLGTGMITHKYLLGVMPIHWDRHAPSPLTWPAVPVVVVGMRVLQDGSKGMVVVEKRDLIDPRMHTITAYLVPAHRLRVPKSDLEYDQIVAGLEDTALDRKRGLLRQKALFPWTHAVVRMNNEDAPTLESEDERFVRRATLLLEWISARPEDEDNAHAHRPTCADYIYNQGQEGAEGNG
jgi:hypothetical protein